MRRPVKRRKGERKEATSGSCGELGQRKVSSKEIGEKVRKRGNRRKRGRVGEDETEEVRNKRVRVRSSRGQGRDKPAGGATVAKNVFDSSMTEQAMRVAVRSDEARERKTVREEPRVIAR